MTLPTRTIPALDLDVSAIGLGCMGISWAYTSVDARDDEAGVEIVLDALRQGVSFLDTSDVYGAGHNELIVGRALAQARIGFAPPPQTGHIVVATKAGLIGDIVDDQIVLSRDGRPEHLRAACDASLVRLGVDVIDLYYLHRVDENVPLEESWGALSDLVTQGKVRALGLSEVSLEQAAASQVIHPVAAIQSELSLWTRDALGQGLTSDGSPSGDLISWTRDHDAVFVPFSPLGRGFLTGALDASSLSRGDFRAGMPRFQAEALSANEAIVDVVRRVASRHGVHPAAVALAWVLAQGDHVIPIPGTTKPEHLRANLAAASLQLTAQDLAELDGAPAAAGSRY